MKHSETPMRKRILDVALPNLLTRPPRMVRLSLTFSLLNGTLFRVSRRSPVVPLSWKEHILLQTDDSAAGPRLTDFVTPKNERSKCQQASLVRCRYDFGNTPCFGHIPAAKGGQVIMGRTSANTTYDGSILIMQ